MIKSPKLYFYDVGLASYLIGIDDVRQVPTHPLRGPLFENIAVIEMLKNRFNRGHRPQLSFFRDSSGLECDLLCETGYGFHAFEIKAGVTVTSDSFKSLDKVGGLLPHVVSKTVVYGGTTQQQRSDCTAIPLSSFGAFLDSAPVSALDATIEHPDLQTTPSDTDRVVAEVITALLDQIADQTKA